MKINSINDVVFGKAKNNIEQKMYEPNKVYSKQEAINWLLDTLNKTKIEIKETNDKIKETETQNPNNTKLLRMLNLNLAVLNMRISDISSKLDYMYNAPDDEKMVIRLNIIV